MLPTKNFSRRQFIYSEGELASEMYIVKEGTVKIVKKTAKDFVVIGVIEKNSFFGEVALLRDETHSTTAIADTDCELIIIKKELFYDHFEKLPDWMEIIIKSMAHRLHDALEKLGNQRLTKKAPPQKQKKEQKENEDTETKEKTSENG